MKQPTLRWQFVCCVFAWLLPALILATTLMVWKASDIPPGFFSRDPTATLGGKSYTGAQSSLGILVWGGGAVVCGFTALILGRRRGTLDTRVFLGGGSLFTSTLLIDDLFCIHESRTLEAWHISEPLVFGFYGVIFIAWAWISRRIILASHICMLGAAFVLFAASIGVDLFQDTWDSPWRIFFEDGFKLLGIFSWSAYLILTSRRILRVHLVEP